MLNHIFLYTCVLSVYIW